MKIARISNTLTVAALALASAANTASAQSFVHHIGEPTDSFEDANDLTIYSTGEIIFVGGIENPGFGFFGLVNYIVINNPAGVPLASWIVQDFDTPELNPSIAVREDLADGNLIVLQQGNLIAGAPEDYVLFKIDPFTGVIPYAWRYSGTNQGENLGMELDGPTGLVAAAVRNPTSGALQTSLLRYDQGSGLPIFHFRYPVIDAPVFNSAFYDAMVFPDTGDIYAVGYADIDDPFTGISNRRLLIGRFDTFGTPIWYRLYDAILPDDIDRRLEGVSIEIGANNVIGVTGRRDSPNLGSHALHMTIDPFTGAPFASSIIATQGGGIIPATSSLEFLFDGTHRPAGTNIGPDGLPLPAMWNVDGFSPALNWWWSPAPQEGFGAGDTAIPNRTEGVLLGGQIFPIMNGPFGSLDDALLAQTPYDGKGLCPFVPPLFVIEPLVDVFDVPILRQPMPIPEPAGLQSVPGQPQVGRVCAASIPCPTDLNGDGVTDLADLLIVLASFGIDAGGDVNGDSVTDLADLLAVLAAFGTPCP